MKKHLSTILLVLILVIGMFLLLYPTFADWWNDLHQSRAIASYSEEVEQIDEERYTVIYEIFASNLMPDITVLDNRA